MKVSQDAILQAAATITAAKIQVGGALAVVGGAQIARAASAEIDAKQILEKSIAEVLAAIDYTEKNKSLTYLKTWGAIG